MSAISQTPLLISQLWKGCEILHALKSHFRSRTPISQVVSQLWNHPLAHECHFAAPYPHFVAAKWVLCCEMISQPHSYPLQKSPLVAKMFLFFSLWLRNDEMGCENVSFFPYGCEMISKLRNGCEMISKLQNGYENAPGFKMGCETPFGCEMISQPHSYPLPNPPFAVKMAFWLWNDFQTSKWLRNDFRASKWVAKMFLFSLWLQNGQRECFFFSLLLWNGLQTLKWLRNGLQATKIDLRKEGRFVKTSCKANRSCENANRAPQPCI